MNRHRIAWAVAAALIATGLDAQMCNLKVVTDASPDYTDMDSMVHSATSNWESDADKMWALFYWVHKARRQTEPMKLHGKAETDPIRQFNDYGFAMCSTISGIKCSIWQHMGYPVKYYDIALHTVPEVFYDNAWHHYDSSLSVVYTLCDGKTVAGIEDIGKTLACDASAGKEEPGHIAIYHALNGTGPDGFLEGADTIRDLRHLGRDTYAPDVLKYRYYLYDAERGHRYILNLRENEVYTRHYTRLDGNGGKEKKSDPAYFTPNGRNRDGTPRDPEAENFRYRIRGNGVRTFEPNLSDAALLGSIHSSRNIRALGAGLQPAAGGEAEAIFKIEGANVITSTTIAAELLKASGDDLAAIQVSTNNGMTWKDVYTAEAQGVNAANIRLIEEVNGAYEVLVRVQMHAKGQPSDVQLKSIRFETITQLNSKTQPRLNLGKNTIYVGAGEQTESIVVWPDLQGEKYKPLIVDENNIKTRAKHEGWNAVMNPGDKGEGYVVFKIDAPRHITSFTQGARMYVRNPKSSISFEHSFDDGATWTRNFTFEDTEAPWDDIHNQVIRDVPAGTKTVLFKYVLNNAGLYSVRMEANHKPADTSSKPMEVTFNWAERQQDRSTVKRSHTQLIEQLPATYTINVGGYDQPVVESLVMNLKGARGELAYGYNDGKDVGGEKWVGQWTTYGKNLAFGKPYTVSVPPSENSWDAHDDTGTRLTDGIVGSSYSGGTSYRSGPLWQKNKGPDITVDLGEKQKAAAFRVHIHGYPWQDAVRGMVEDAVEVLVSDDGQQFTSVGKFDFNLYWKDIPVNYMFTDEETFAGHNHTLLMDNPVDARFVQFKVKPGRMMVISEVQVLDSVTSVPFDLKVALPK